MLTTKKSYCYLLHLGIVLYLLYFSEKSRWSLSPICMEGSEIIEKKRNWLFSVLFYLANIQNFFSASAIFSLWENVSYISLQVSYSHWQNYKIDTRVSSSLLNKTHVVCIRYKTKSAVQKVIYLYLFTHINTDSGRDEKDSSW